MSKYPICFFLSTSTWTNIFPRCCFSNYIGILDLHNDIFAYLILTIVLVLTVFAWIIWRFNYSLLKYPSFASIQTFKKILLLSSINHGVMLEIIWTIVPALILIVIAIPSFSLLYASDDILDPEITLK